MKIFYNYFFKTLNWMPLYKNSVISMLIAGISDYFERVKDDAIQSVKQFIPSMTDDENIQSIAISRGILRSKFDTDHEFRKRVVGAYPFLKLAAKEVGLIEILSTYGLKGFQTVNVAIEDNAKWAEFDAVFSHNSIFDGDNELLKQLINRYKPARSKIRKIEFSYNRIGTIYHGGLFRCYQSLKLSM